MDLEMNAMSIVFTELNHRVKYEFSSNTFRAIDK